MMLLPLVSPSRYQVRMQLSILSKLNPLYMSGSVLSEAGRAGPV